MSSAATRLPAAAHSRWTAGIAPRSLTWQYSARSVLWQVSTSSSRSDSPNGLRQLDAESLGLAVRPKSLDDPRQHSLVVCVHGRRASEVCRFGELQPMTATPAAV